MEKLWCLNKEFHSFNSNVAPYSTELLSFELCVVSLFASPINMDTIKGTIGVAGSNPTHHHSCEFITQH